ncbi:CRISPR-associated RAMP protein Csx7 [Acidianus sp. HS-5]|uniref:type III CRISPR-associated RAMP protein Csx7 n=1 Tax=Acidianus sp. HS-5 TaxID=2886040 RepID=UPI001F01BD5A|nr:CRISPR-associated RAMP protein Csx7 [Acidianus sp. HS-5]BDC17507.1 CRISPR-associated RAMP protein [Acidianus sp. HS-5]
MDFSSFQSIYEITGKLANLSSLRIGTGKVSRFDEPTDNPVITINGKPYIPGSTMKGALRNLVEMYSKTRGWNIIYPYEKVNAKDEEEEEKAYANCIPCYLFGSPAFASRVFVFDSPISSDYVRTYRTMVAINRTFGAQQPKNLYTLDYIEPGASFDFRMRVFNVDLEEPKEETEKEAVEAFRFALSLLINEGIMIGNRKSIGLGLVKLENPTVVKFTLKEGMLKEEKIEVKKILGEK